MAVLQTLFEISVYSAVIFAAIMLFKKAFRSRISPKLHYAVWALLIVRLMLPLTIDSGLRLFVIPQERAQAQQTTENVSTLNTVNNMEQKHSTDPSYNQGNEAVPSVKAGGLKTTEQFTADKAAPEWSLGDTLLTVWLTGAGAFLIYAAFAYTLFRLRVAKDAAPATERLRRLFEQCKQELGIKSGMNVLQVYNIGTPALLFPSIILIPSEFLASTDDEQMTYALRHELTHYKHKHHIVSALLVLLQAVYWFDPFVWMAFRQVRLDIEVACDSSVVKLLGSREKSRYANMIVSMFAVDRRQTALGMARGDAKKAAEMRVRGIFMDLRSKGSSKLVSAVLAALLLLTCFTTACQPTPEAPVVAPRNETYEEREVPSGTAGTPAETLTREELGIPDNVSESYDLGGILTLNIDADVKTGSDLASYKVYRGALTDFTEQQAEHFADMFVKDVTLTAYDDRYTKEEITEYLLLPAQKTLSELENGTYVKDPNNDGDVPTIENMEETVGLYEQWLADAPEERTDASVSVDSYEKNGRYFYGEFPIEGSKIKGKFMVGTGLRNECGGFNYYNSKYDLVEPHNLRPEPAAMALPEGGLNIKTTPEQAVELATQVKDGLGAEGLDFYAVMQAKAWVEEMGMGSIAAYYVVFTRRIDGVPVLYCPENMMSSSYSTGQANEKLVVTVDDTGVIAVNWMGNTQVADVINEKPEFIGFDKAMECAKKQVKAIYSQKPEGYESRETVTVNIDSVSLEYLRMKEPNGGDNDVRFVPAWVFNGSYTTVYSDEAMRQNEYIKEKEETYPIGKPIVVNALDGSAFDTRYADGIEPPMDAKPFAPKS